MAQGMCVYLMIRRKKTTIFTDAKETTNVSELKKIIHGKLRGKPGVTSLTFISLVCSLMFVLLLIIDTFLCCTSGITKVAPENQRLFKDDRVMEDTRCLADYGLISTTARAQSPASLSLTCRYL